MQRFWNWLAMKVAWLLPRRVVMWATIRVGAHATTGAHSSHVVPELRFMDAVQRWGVVALVLVQPAVSWAQEAAAAVADAGDTFASLYLVAGGVAAAALGALIVWGVSKLKGTQVKELIGRFLTVFNVGLQGAHGRFKAELEAARASDSDGGVVITDKEWATIRTHMWDYLVATYGSLEAITKVVGVIIGSTEVGAVRAFVDAKIDAGLAQLERADRAARPPAPAT